ncbi:hypothetical protein TBK1r_36510 [Stieleria magnilauensis]|uniref:Uncharacterized protein n=1 Tax=Stieleria magnilauensis TaxID=2527963 RepID=A0ABX5XXY6_9BACT|nr:hypothetical protein TBK1r_36510 [Planctomycetes bacterium TBK1r]
MRQKAFASQRFSAGNQTIVQSNASGIRIRNMIVMNCGTPATQPAQKTRPRSSYCDVKRRFNQKSDTEPEYSVSTLASN